MNAGNAAGAKGRQFETVNRGNMPRHRADYAHDNQTYSLHAMGVSSPMVNDSNWEPDGVTLQVRFCEGGATYQLIGMRAATLPLPHSGCRRKNRLCWRPACQTRALAVAYPARETSLCDAAKPLSAVPAVRAIPFNSGAERLRVSIARRRRRHVAPGIKRHARHRARRPGLSTLAGRDA